MICLTERSRIFDSYALTLMRKRETASGEAVLAPALALAGAFFFGEAALAMITQ